MSLQHPIENEQAMLIKHEAHQTAAHYFSLHSRAAALLDLLLLLLGFV